MLCWHAIAYDVDVFLMVQAGIARGTVYSSCRYLSQFNTRLNNFMLRKLTSAGTYLPTYLQL